MRAIIFTPDRDSAGKRDDSAAFQPEAETFARLHGIPRSHVLDIDVSKPNAAGRARVIAAIAAAPGPLELVAFFCHGLRSGIQVGFSSATAAELAKSIASNSVERIVVALYCCSTAGGPGPGGDGGFADRLRDELCKAGRPHCEVNGHDRAGHCTRLPFVRRFEGRGSPVGGTGGTWLVDPKSVELWGPWRRALQSKTDTLRLRFPVMSIASIHHELLALEAVS